MKLVKLSNICQIIAGQSPPSNSYNRNESGLPFYQGKTDFGNLYPIEKVWCSNPIKIAEPNDILISVRAPVGPTNLCNKRACIGRGLSSIRVGEKINNFFLLYFLRFYEPYLINKSRGSTFQSITQDDLKNIQIPLPPLEEQKCIVDILDRVDALRQKRRQSIDLLDEYLKAVFLDMFGDPVTNPKGWEVVKVIDVCNCIVPGRDKPKSFTGNIPWITTDDLNHLDYTSKSNKNIGLTSEEIDKVKAKIIPKDSVLITCVGDLGVISIAENEMIVNQQLHTFQCSNKANNVFLMYSLSYQKQYMYKMATLTTVPYMNKTVCNNIPTILPPVTLQRNFASIIKKTQSIKYKMENEKQELDNLFNSLMQKAFKGDL